MPVSAQSSRKVQFSSYTFDPATGDFARRGTRLRLEAQPAKVLALLLAAGGELVPRSELIAALWPGETEGDFDRRLDKAIAKLRAGLNDDPTKPKYIETLKGRGYRFLDTVVPEPEAESERETGETPLEIAATPPAPAQVVGLEPNATSPVKGAFRWRFTVRHGAVAAALAIAVLASAWFLRVRSIASRHEHPVVAILGFEDASKSADQDWMSRSIADWLSSDLGADGDLKVFQAEHNPDLQVEAGGGCGPLPPRALAVLGEKFDSDFAVYGSYSAIEDGASGDRWRLDVCLADLRSHKETQSITVVGTKGEIGRLVLDAGQLVRSKLGLKPLSRQSFGYLRAALPSDLGAARLYAEGTSALEHFDPEEASALLTQAAQIEPRHAATHAALSTAWATLGYQEKSRQEALAALDLAKDLSPAQQLEYAALADEAKSDWMAAANSYGRLLQLHPDNIGYGVKLAGAWTSAAKPQLALEALNALRGNNHAAAGDPRVDLAEASADAALSDFKGELAASTRAESRAEAGGDALLVADARMDEGDADDALDNWGEALRLWRSASQSYEWIGDRGGMAKALNRQAALAWKKGDAANATKLFNESMGLSKAIGDAGGLAYSLSRLGGVRMSMERATGGEMPEAVQMYRQAASIYHAIGNTAEEGYVYSLIGDEAMQRTKYDEARAFYQQAMALSQATNDKSRVAGRLLDLGIVDLAQGDNPQAIQLLRQSSAAFEELGQRDRAAIARIRLGISLFRSGSVEDAEKMLEESLAAMRSFGRLNQVREVLGDLADVEVMQNPAKAEMFAREMLKINRQLLPADVCCSASYAKLAETLLPQGKLPQARESIRQAFLPGEKVISLELLPSVLLARGDVRRSARDYRAAGADFARSLRMYRARSERYMELEARLGLAETDFVKQRQSAGSELERLRQEAERLGYGIIAIKIDAFLHSARTSAAP